MSRRPLKPGDRVRLIRGIAMQSRDAPRATAVVAWLMMDVDGGIRLAEPLAGFKYWNSIDLERAPGAKKISANRPGVGP